MLKVSEEILAFRFVQPAHESSVLVLQTVQGIKSNRFPLVATIHNIGGGASIGHAPATLEQKKGSLTYVYVEQNDRDTDRPSF